MNQQNRHREQSTSARHTKVISFLIKTNRTLSRKKKATDKGIVEEVSVATAHRGSLIQQCEGR